MSYKPKWTKGCKAELKLQELLDSGEATFDMAPMTIKGLSDEFSPYSDAVFRSHLNKLKAFNGKHLPEDKKPVMSMLEDNFVTPEKSSVKNGKKILVFFTNIVF